MAEDKRIEKMAECCPYFWNGGCTVDASKPTDCDLMCEMFGFMTNLVRADFFNREWISVNERLPENEQMVLTIDTQGEMQVCFYETAWEGIFQQFHGLVKIYNITHWMPLPEPPETKGETE